MLRPTSDRAPAANEASLPPPTRRPGVLPRSASRLGVLHAQAAARSFELLRIPPSEDLAFFVERHWIVRWDLRGRDPCHQATLSHPCVNLVVEAGRSAVHGVSTRRSEVLLEGEGQVVGTKLRPGAFFPFAGDKPKVLVDCGDSQINAAEEITSAPIAGRGVRVQMTHAGINFYPLHTPLLHLETVGKRKPKPTGIVYATLFDGKPSRRRSFDFVLRSTGNDKGDGGLARGAAEAYEPITADRHL